MKAISGETMRRMELRAIEESSIPALTLMEKAGKGCAEAIIDRFPSCPDPRAVIFAGKGNNGGDGFVIARILREKGWQVTIFVLARREEIKGDALAKLDLLEAKEVIFCSGLDCCIAPLREATVIIDALLGTGLKSEVVGLFAEAVNIINSSGRPVVSVDIPSGIDSASGKILGCAVKADLTVTFALAKLGHILYPGAEFSGELKIVDIGIPTELTEAAKGYEFLDAPAIRPLLKGRGKIAHKGDGGHCLIIAGSTGKTGAAAMAANGALRTGAGLVTLAVPASLNHILEVKTTEVMTLPVPDGGTGFFGNQSRKPIEAALTGKAVVALGPGISWQSETARLVRELSASITLPMVIDADGLNALSEDPDLILRKKSATIILTPHPGEMARLAGVSISQIESDRIGVARGFAEKYGIWLILKGARTIIAAPDGAVAINGSGNPGMASGGMGDVLTGVLAALIGQGYDPFSACRLGVFIHGHAADLVAAEKGEIGISAVDVQERLPYAFKDLIS
ncbi:MAG TPA: NAD(P)H-hydrate dehydratase [Geobacteraceae bacterium]|nr:NAD(P)H-hydrate dehydratase [Geobacteraceae bacterium]